MRSLAMFLGFGLLTGCMAATQTGSGPSTASASRAAFTVAPRPEPTPLPALSPATRTNREIERLGSAELARWILPDRAGEIAAAELFPARWGITMAAYLWRAPRPAGPRGVCQVDGWSVGFQPENGSLTPQQSLDPPLRPAWTLPERRFRVAGSTLDTSETPDCTAGRPFWRWSEAPSAEAIHRAVDLMEQAQVRARRPGPPGFRLGCTRMRIDEATGATSDRACPDPRAFLQLLTPDLIKRVLEGPCEGDIDAAPGGGCVIVEYHDPNAPGTYSVYMVRLAGQAIPQSVEIVQGMLPPQ